MAVKQTIYLSGKINNVVFYKRNEKWFAREVPDKVRQSAATKKRSKNFGIASRAGKILRWQLTEILEQLPPEKRMQNRFSGAIASWLETQDPENLSAGNVGDLEFFDFNESTAIRERLRVPLTVSRTAENLLQLHIPGFIPTEKLSAPAHTLSAEIQVCAASCGLVAGTGLGNAVYAFSIPYNGEPVPEKFIPLPVPTVPGSLVVTGMAIHYKLPAGKKLKPAFMPSSLIWAEYC